MLVYVTATDWGQILKTAKASICLCAQLYERTEGPLVNQLANR